MAKATAVSDRRGRHRAARAPAPPAWPGALEADRSRCADCGRTPLIGEQIHLYEDRAGARGRLRALPPAAPRGAARERARAPRRARPHRAPHRARRLSAVARGGHARRLDSACAVDPRDRLDRHLRAPRGASSTTSRTSPTTPSSPTTTSSTGTSRGSTRSAVGAGARFRVKAPRQPLQLGRCDVRRGRAPAPHRRGRAAPARTTASAPLGVYELDPRRRRRHPRPLHARRPRPRRSPTGCWRASARAAGCSRKNASAHAPAARDHRAGPGLAAPTPARRGGASPSPVGRLPRRMTSRLRKLPLALLRRSSPCSRSAPAATRTRRSRPAPTRASPAPNAPYLNVGPLIYQVQLSRELNPYQQRGLRLSAGADAGRSASSNPARSGSRCSCRSTTTANSRCRRAETMTISDTQGNVYTPVVPEHNQRLRLPRRAGAAEKPAPDRRHHRRLRPHPGLAAALQDQSRLARQPPAGAEDRQSRRPRRNRPRPSSTSERDSDAGAQRGFDAPARATGAAVRRRRRL